MRYRCFSEKDMSNGEQEAREGNSFNSGGKSVENELTTGVAANSMKDGETNLYQTKKIN